MDNLVALVVVLCFVAALMVLAAMWFYALAALCVLYGVMRFSAVVWALWSQRR